MNLGVRPTWVQVQLFHSLPMWLLAGFLTAYASVSSFVKGWLKASSTCFVIRNNKWRKLESTWHSRSSGSEDCSRRVLTCNQRELHSCAEATFYVHWYIYFVSCPSFLPIPFLLLNGENQSFPINSPGLFWAWQRKHTPRGPAQLKQELRHLEVPRQQQEAAASWGLSGSCRRPLPNNAECPARSCSWVPGSFASTGTHTTAGGCASSKHLS